MSAKKGTKLALNVIAVFKRSESFAGAQNLVLERHSISQFIWSSSSRQISVLIISLWSLQTPVTLSYSYRCLFFETTNVDTFISFLGPCTAFKVLLLETKQTLCTVQVQFGARPTALSPKNPSTLLLKTTPCNHASMPISLSMSIRQ